MASKKRPYQQKGILAKLVEHLLQTQEDQDLSQIISNFLKNWVITGLYFSLFSSFQYS